MTLSMATLRNEQIGKATGMFNLMRNLGGSIGISLTTTFLARGAQAHQVAMVAHMTPYDFAYQQRLAAVQAGLTPLTGAPQAQQQAYAALQGTMLQQATLGAFLDVFHWIALFIAAYAPIVLLMNRAATRRRGGGPPAEL
jgi:MFS transporter, DHA2 family, multidrug resistance protein